MPPFLDHWELLQPGPSRLVEEDAPLSPEKEKETAPISPEKQNAQKEVAIIMNDDNDEFLFAMASAVEEQRAVVKQDERGAQTEVSTLRVQKMVWKKG